MNNRNLILALVAASALAGCASPKDNVIFVTKTSLSIVDVDGTPPGVSFAYDRGEGYLGPRFENGSVPPVIAKISSNGKLVDRDIKQYYATGTAANRLAGDNKSDPSGTELKGTREPMFFGTATTLGIKIGFTASTPPDFILGYRRKELSVIPIGTTMENGKEEHHYPSVIGVFSNDVQAGGRDSSTLGLTQFFATGTAAIALTDVPGMKSSFQGFGTDAVDAFKDASRSQQRLLLSLMYCVTKVEDAKFGAVLKNVDELGLISNVAAIKTVAATNMRAARADYVKAISVVNVDPPERTGRLEGHAVYVCGL